MSGTVLLRVVSWLTILPFVALLVAAVVVGLREGSRVRRSKEDEAWDRLGWVAAEPHTVTVRLASGPGVITFPPDTPLEQVEAFRQRWKAEHPPLELYDQDEEHPSRWLGP